MSETISSPAPGTRERLLDSAERLFASRGFMGASVREITEAAGANLGAVNYHFRSKEGLYAEVFAHRAALMREPFMAAARAAALVARRRPDLALQTLGRAFLAPHENRDASQRLLALLTREAIEERLPHRTFVRDYVVPTIDAIASIVRQIRPALSEATARECAHAFFAQLMHIVRGADAAAGPLEERLDHAVRFTVAGIRHLEGGGPARARATTERRQS